MLSRSEDGSGRHGEQTGPGWGKWGACHLSPSNELPQLGCPSLKRNKLLNKGLKFGSCSAAQLSSGTAPRAHKMF